MAVIHSKVCDIDDTADTIKEKVCEIGEKVEANHETLKDVLEKVIENGVKIEECCENGNGGEGQDINVTVNCNGDEDVGTTPPVGCDECPNECATCPPGIFPTDPCETSGNFFEDPDVISMNPDGKYRFRQKGMSKSHKGWKDFFLATSSMNIG